jgi:hypothetical protein
MSSARIRIHDDGYGRLHLRWWADDTVLWHDILTSFKARFPTHHDRSYSAQTKTWSVRRSRYGRLADWVDEWFASDCQQWDDEEPAGASGRTYDSHSSYSHYRRPQTSTSAVDAAYAHLCLTPDAPAELVRTVHHWWVRALHPDTGHGDGARMASINAAVDVIRADQERKAS